VAKDTKTNSKNFPQSYCCGAKRLFPACLEFPQKAALTVRRNEFDGIFVSFQDASIRLFLETMKFRQGHSFHGQNEGASWVKMAVNGPCMGIAKVDL